MESKVKIKGKKLANYFEKWIEITCELNKVAESKGTEKRTMLQVLYRIKKLFEDGMIEVDDEELAYLDYTLENQERYPLDNVLTYRKYKYDSTRDLR